MMAWDVMLALRLNVPVRAYDRQHAVNPIINCFQAAPSTSSGQAPSTSSGQAPSAGSGQAGRWFWLLLLQADRHWPDLCRAIGREDLLSDERFSDIALRREHAPELVEELDRVFATKTLQGGGGGPHR